MFFSTQKMMRHTESKGLLWQHLIRMIIDKICKMTAKGVKLKSESFFSIYHGVLELRRKNLRFCPLPGMDRVNERECQARSHNEANEAVASPKISKKICLR